MMQKFLTVVIAICIFSSILPKPEISNAEQIIEEKIYVDVNLEDDFEADKVLVTLNEEASFSSKNYTIADFSDVGCIAVENLTEEATLVAQGEKQNDMVNLENYRRVLSLRLNVNSKENVLETIESLMAREDVLSAEPNYKIELCSYTPTDLYNSFQWAISDQQLPKVWEVTAGDSDVLVGIIDSGIDWEHTELSSQLRHDLCRQFIDGELVANPNPIDTNGHGTHVAGIIGAASDNVYGITGVNFSVGLVSLKMTGDYNSDVLGRIINYACGMGIKILNLSAGLSEDISDSQTIDQLIRSYNGLFICAAGNSSLNISKNDDKNVVLPATLALDNLITVGAYNSSGAISSISNYGSAVDIYAPGENILSTFSINQCCIGANDENVEFTCTDGSTIKYCELSIVYRNAINNWRSTYNVNWEYINNNFYEITKNTPEECRGSVHHSNGYHYMDGTSMAAPYVTGVAALLLAVKPDLTAQQLKAIIIDSATSIKTPVDGENEQTGKKLGSFYAIRKVLSDYILPVVYLGDSISQSKTIDAENYDFLAKNFILKLNVQTAHEYSFKIESTKELEVEMYNGNSMLINTLNRLTLNNGQKVIFSYNLSTGCYYIRVRLADEDEGGVINLNISSISHTHAFGDFMDFGNMTYHYRYCECGGVEIEEHSISALYENERLHTLSCSECDYSVNRPHTFYITDLTYCIECHAYITAPGIGGIVHPGWVAQMVTANGSYILPNGCIVLVLEDVEAYYSGTLVFYDASNPPQTA